MSNRKGFTLIELLIVVVIIGILAAIAIPKFAATKDKAKLASVKTDLRNTETAQEAYFSDFTTYGTMAQLNTAVQAVWLARATRVERAEAPIRMPRAGQPRRPIPPSRAFRATSAVYTSAQA